MTAANTLEIRVSPGFAIWLGESGTSLAAASPDGGKLFLLGSASDGKVRLFERTFPYCQELRSRG